jgi:hypothetical protein
MPTTTKKQSNASRVHEIILDDPGVSCQHIQARLDDLTGKQVSLSLAFLRRTDKIVNLGKVARGASWYPNGH